MMQKLMHQLLAVLLSLVVCKSAARCNMGWVAQITASGKSLCTGVVVDVNWVLTAATCVKGEFEVVLGKHCLKYSRKRPQIIQPAFTVTHPKYNKKHYLHDLAMVRLSEPVKIPGGKKNVMSNIANENEYAYFYRNRITRRIRCGYLDVSEKSGDSIKMEIIQLQSDNICSSQGFGWYSEQYSVCYANGGTCTNAKSGELLVCVKKRGKREATLVGINSFGEHIITNSKIIKAGSKISSYREWILGIINREVCPRGYQYDCAGTSCIQPKVLILGAGMSGISTAKYLRDVDFTNFQIIEGSKRVGGRMRAAKVGSYTLEVGALWIYGKGTNPIFDLAKKYDLSFVRDTDTWIFRDRMGNDVTEAANKTNEELEAIMGKLLRLAARARANGTDDLNVRAQLRHLGWNPKTPLDDAIETYVVDFETGVPPEYRSANLVYFEPFTTFGDDTLLYVNDPGGFSKVARGLLADTTVGMVPDPLMLNKVITKIEQTKDNVTVYAEDGSMYTADYVVCTFSIGVLQQRKVEFLPQLPREKLLAIDKYGLGNFFHLYMLFPFTFWDDEVYVIYVPTARGRNSVWVNINQIYPGCNIFHLSVFDVDSRRLGRLTQQEIHDDMLETLQIMYPNKFIPNATEIVFYNWADDPLFRGAWSYVPSGFTPENDADLAAPFGRIHFAGEHFTARHHGYVHSAFMSGERVVNQLLSKFQRHGF